MRSDKDGRITFQPPSRGIRQFRRDTDPFGELQQGSLVRQQEIEHRPKIISIRGMFPEIANGDAGQLEEVLHPLLMLGEESERADGEDLGFLMTDADVSAFCKHPEPPYRSLLCVGRAGQRLFFLAFNGDLDHQRHHRIVTQDLLGLFRYRGRLRAPFFGVTELGGSLAVLRLRLPPRFDSIHPDMAAELALAASGMTMPFSCAIFSANNICAGLGGLGPGSPAVSSPAFWGACWSRNVRQIDPDFV